MSIQQGIMQCLLLKPYVTVTLFLRVMFVQYKKDHKYLRRSTKKTLSFITVSWGAVAYYDQDTVLGNSNNKEQLISLLSNQLRSAIINVANCDDDADTQIAFHAITFAGNGEFATVVADDTDVFLHLVMEQYLLLFI